MDGFTEGLETLLAFNPKCPFLLSRPNLTQIFPKCIQGLRISGLALYTVISGFVEEDSSSLLAVFFSLSAHAPRSKYIYCRKESTFDLLLMDESSSLPAPETNITALKEALYTKQDLLQKLYNELDEEREASASAASEALSMILRLQGEKASLKLEASQYKRMAEEKMCHAEEALAVVEELIYQRELEIASLEYQVQAYRYRLISMGCNDLGVYENTFPENLLMQRNDALCGESVANGNIRKFNSLPQVSTKDANFNKSTIERKRSVVPVPDSMEIDVEEIAIREVNDSEKKSGSSGAETNSYWEQIKRLDERVKEISDGKDSGRNKSTIWKGGTWSPSLFSQMGIGSSGDATRKINAIHSDKVKQHQDSQVSVQDIFEVPQITESCKVSEPPLKERHKLTLEDENRLQKPDIASEDIPESPKKDERDLKKLPKQREGTGVEKKLPKPREGTSVHRNVSPTGRPTFSVSNSQAEYQQLSQRVERLERARNNTRQEIIAEGEEELSLLKEIREQLNSIQSDIRSLTTKKPHVPDEPPLDLLQEPLDLLQEQSSFYGLNLHEFSGFDEFCNKESLRICFNDSKVLVSLECLRHAVILVLFDLLIGMLIVK
ncbi:unnamed protein product [Dovyalis caffra]|uniref:GTD-binding domain-containing protein n=1 Tax=Dovyalis caffra TaxID=77055 RepID=A0AAV1RR34_9ROSI|nr:unnamed protein product [Dovyalis caffra]